MRTRLFRPVLSALLSAAATLLPLSVSRPCHAQASPTQDGPVATTVPDVRRVHLIGNDDIIRMKNAGLADDVLLQTIQLQPGHYATGPDDLILLKQAGISDRIISAMQVHDTGLVQRGISAPATVPATRPVAPPPLAPELDEIGVYYKDKNGEWQPLQTERVEFRGSNRLKSALTNGILREDTNGWLADPKSTLVLPTGTTVLIFTPHGTQADEYDFLRLNEHKDSRDFRVKTGGVFHSQTGAGKNELVFNPKRIAPQMYTFVVPKDIEVGEYAVLPPGSANQAGMAHAGKIFTFSVRE